MPPPHDVMYTHEGYVGGDYDYTDHPDLIYSLALQLLLLHGETICEALGDVIFTICVYTRALYMYVAG